MSLPVQQVIISVHGVRSDGSWADDLMTRCRADGRFDKTLFLPISYPWTMAVMGWAQTWLPFARHRMTDWMERQLVRIQSQFPTATIDVVAHSYGTWLVWHAIRRSFEHDVICKIRRLILIGSVLRSDDPLLSVARGQVTFLTNHWSSNDLVVLAAPPPFGHAGQTGLRARMTGVENSRDWGLRHTGYFEDERFWTDVVEQVRP